MKNLSRDPPLMLSLMFCSKINVDYILHMHGRMIHAIEIACIGIMYMWTCCPKMYYSQLYSKHATLHGVDARI